MTIECRLCLADTKISPNFGDRANLGGRAGTQRNEKKEKARESKRKKEKERESTRKHEKARERTSFQVTIEDGTAARRLVGTLAMLVADAATSITSSRPSSF
jgi:hypothetical protein